jgi:hypothetical protein
MQIQYLEIVTKEVETCAPHTHQQMGCSSVSPILDSAYTNRRPARQRAVWGTGKEFTVKTPLNPPLVRGETGNLVPSPYQATVYTQVRLDWI